MGNSNTTKNGLPTLLSQDHLQYLYSQFLGVRKSRKKASNAKDDTSQSEFLLWDKVTGLIRETSDATMPNLSLDGLAFTINEHLRQLATVISNMWEGSIYKKSMDYLLRILLRLHLAPERERRYQERIKSRKPKNNDIRKQTMTKSLWKYKINRLCNQLSEALQYQGNSSNKSNRINIITRRLLELNTLEPKPCPSSCSFLSLEQQLQALRVSTDSESGIDDEEDYDGYDDDDDDDDDNDDDIEEHVKEPSRQHLRSLQSVLKILLESPHINGKINSNWVQKTAHTGSNFTPHECRVVADLANALRPFVPKRRQDPNDASYYEPIPHVMLRAPLVLIANAVLQATRYSQFTRQVSPQISPSSTHGLILGAKGIFEVYCGRSENQYSIVGINGAPLTSGNDVSKNKRAIFESFFDMDKIQKLCLSNGLKFANR
jgi:hypothetical protein